MRLTVMGQHAESLPATSAAVLFAGAHLLLQGRTQVLNDDLPAVFRRWYPRFTHAPEPIARVA